ncbi:helicase-related protein [Acuticoccus sp. MNP-M23]|nr:helicase-related protein [Acuticoccus sp. MNP-M23]WMS45054.1 helicase-related protein [Acuticoccus sp. MNP-M23]
MLAHRSGVIGLPLRLLAREVYGRIVARIGPDEVALITGEEKIIPPGARYHVATVEAMPLDLDAEFVAIDEVQLAADLERGRVFTDRILRVRGRFETLLLGALTARQLLEKLLPGLNVVTRPRMSMLTYAGQKKLTRLPPRSAVVAFSANEVYAIAELIRRQRGGTAIVMGALSPRTRNAQVELFQNGDVDFLIATDAIGMGLNLDVDHVAFASNRKFDGYQFRALNAGELGQIAGRAGRHTSDGTFGVTGRVAPFDNELVEALETHSFMSAKVFQWRNPDLDFSSVNNLRKSLDEPAREEGLTKAPPADDQKALEYATKTPEVMDMASNAARVERLWEVCQVPDYRKIAPANHGDMLLALYQFLIRDGAISDDWIARQVRYADRTDGDIDTLSNRIAHIRTWTFVANRNDWLADPAEWRETTRQVEDRLSDALHQRLMQRFVDRRTSVLMKRLRENRMLESEVNDAGDVIVEGQHLGVLHGFRFQTDASTGDPRDQKALRAAASKALIPEMEKRADKAAAAPDTAFSLGSDAGLRWQGALIGKVSATDDTLKPAAVLLADDTLSPAAREKVQGRLAQWLAAHIEGLLKPLFDLRNADALDGGARGLAYRISEGLGSVERGAVAEEAKALDQAARAGLRTLGVRFGAYHIFVPALLKPAPSQLLALLWALKEADLDVAGLQEVPQLSASGRTSIPVDPEIPAALYGVVGFRVCGPRAVRIDILERLADQIRPLVAWRPGPDAGEPPAGAVPSGGAFLVTVTMTSLLGCSGDDFAAVLGSLGYRVERREANAAERDAVEAAQQVRRAAPKKAGKPGRPPIPVRTAAPQPAAAPETEAEPEAGVAAPVDAPTADDTAVADPAADSAQAEAPVDAPADAAQPAVAEPAEATAAAEAPAEAPDAAAVAVPAHLADQPVEDNAEAPAAEAPATSEAEAEAEAPVVIEIWRVPRHQRSEGPRRRRGAPSGDEDAGESRRRPRRGGQRNSPRPDLGQPGSAPRSSQGADPAPGQALAEARGERPDRGPKRGKKRGKGGPPSRTETQQAPRPQRREREADPDSPFAALAALKQKLDKGPGDR